jgi:hypothetical protein
MVGEINRKERTMPQIIIETTGPGERGTEVLRERVIPTDVASDHSSRLLVERIGWALTDAEELEQVRGSSYDDEPSEPFTSQEGTVSDTRVI